MGGYREQAGLMQKGQESQYINMVMDAARGYRLDEYQVSIIALICEKCSQPPTDEQIIAFTDLVGTAQNLMPGGRLKSRQVIVKFAIEVGLK